MLARISSRLAVSGLALTAALAASCNAPAIDLAKTLRVVDIKTGWYDAGVVEGNKNKLVPSISFRLTNGGEPIPGSVQLNAVFRQVGGTEEFGTVFLPGVGAGGLATGATTDPIVFRAPQGYTSTDPRSEILKHRLFVDSQVKVFAKYASGQWTLLGDYKVDRALITR